LCLLKGGDTISSQASKTDRRPIKVGFLAFVSAFAFAILPAKHAGGDQIIQTQKNDDHYRYSRIVKEADRRVEQRRVRYFRSLMKSWRSAKVHSDEVARKEKAAAMAAANNSRQTNTNVLKPVTVARYSNFRLSFYDPAVLGALTMPGGMYSGVAADLSLFPKGTHLRITANNGMIIDRVVNDTGTFIYSNRYQLDVAWPNNQIPSAGVLYATVEVVQ
jgi:3D (Asp-Asp-Asp) domain-containing protein